MPQEEEHLYRSGPSGSLHCSLEGQDMKNALLSVYHKDGIVEFARELADLDFTLYASGGTYKHLTENGIGAVPVSELVGGDAILGHRVVTLSREVHAGLLAKATKADDAELQSLGIPRIDLVCVDLYPLEAEIAKEESTRESVIEQTDIGGPTMIRSGVKGGRIVVCDPADRQRVIDWLKDGEPDNNFVENLASKAEYTIAKYCMASSRYLSNGHYEGIFGERIQTCKYGENGWQSPAYLYTSGSDDPLALDQFKVLEGTPPSYNNYVDIDRMLQTMSHIMEAYAVNAVWRPDVAIGVKHGNTCGAAATWGSSPLASMLAGDPLAIFGGLIMTNYGLREDNVEALQGVMLDGIIVPSITQGAIELLRRKSNKCRFIVNPALADIRLDMTPRVRPVRGGFLSQPNYTFVPDIADEGENTSVVKYGETSSSEGRGMLMAWAIGSTSNSNTVTLVKDNMLIGNGVGQQDRVGACELALARARRSGHDPKGAVAYSDSFFPFPDGPEKLIEAGIRAIFATSGSIRDQQTIDLCKEHGVALYLMPDSDARGFFGH